MSSPERSPRQSAKKNRGLGRWLPYAGAVLLLALILYGLMPRPVAVETAPAVRGDLLVTVNEEGRTRITDRFIISAPVAGQLRRVPFKPGAPIHQGDVLAVIDPAAPELLNARAMERAEAQVAAAAAQLDRARELRRFQEAELARIEKLFEQETVSIEEVERARTQAGALALDVAAAEAALRQAKAELLLASPTVPRTNSVTVTSPIDARVFRLFEESERPVLPGTPLLELGDLSNLEVVIEVLSRDGAAIEPGDRVFLDHWGGDQPLNARVRLVEPSAFTKISALGVEEQRVNVIADILTPLNDRPNLGDGYRVDARIVIDERANIVKVPTGALFRRGNQWHAFVVSDQRAELRPVTRGASNDQEAEILEGLEPGEQVILYPSDKVAAGGRVKVIAI